MGWSPIRPPLVGTNSFAENTQLSHGLAGAIALFVGMMFNKEMAFILRAYIEDRHILLHIVCLIIMMNAFKWLTILQIGLTDTR